MTLPYCMSNKIMKMKIRKAKKVFWKTDLLVSSCIRGEFFCVKKASVHIHNVCDSSFHQWYGQQCWAVISGMLKTKEQTSVIKNSILIIPDIFLSQCHLKISSLWYYWPSLLLNWGANSWCLRIYSFAFLEPHNPKPQHKNYIFLILSSSHPVTHPQPSRLLSSEQTSQKHAESQRPIEELLITTSTVFELYSQRQRRGSMFTTGMQS